MLKTYVELVKKWKESGFISHSQIEERNNNGF